MRREPDNRPARAVPTRAGDATRHAHQAREGNMSTASVSLHVDRVCAVDCPKGWFGSLTENFQGLCLLGRDLILQLLPANLEDAVLVSLELVEEVAKGAEAQNCRAHSRQDSSSMD